MIVSKRMSCGKRWSPIDYRPSFVHVFMLHVFHPSSSLTIVLVLVIIGHHISLPPPNPPNLHTIGNHCQQLLLFSPVIAYLVFFQSFWRLTKVFLYLNSAMSVQFMVCFLCFNVLIGILFMISTVKWFSLWLQMV